MRSPAGERLGVRATGGDPRPERVMRTRRPGRRRRRPIDRFRTEDSPPRLSSRCSAYGPPGGSTTQTCIISGIVSETVNAGQVPNGFTAPKPGGSSPTQTLCACHLVLDPPMAGPRTPATGSWYTTPNRIERPPRIA